MQKLFGKSVLLICPRFFNYEKEIAKALEQLGAKVKWYDDRPSNTFFSKVIIRINKDFIRSRIDKYYLYILKETNGQLFDYIFFVNPESVSIDNLKRLKNAFPAAKNVLYMWDSFKNRKRTKELLPFFDSKFTFDPHDADTYSMVLRPLFYTRDYHKVENSIDKYELLFVGTAHSDRYDFVKQLCLNYDLKNVMLYFYLSSRALFLLKKILNNSFRRVKYEDLSFKSLNHYDISSFMSQSRVILDINHPRQTGLTMRTFETMGVQRKLITTNKDIKKYDFYNESNIFVIDRNNPVLDKHFFDSPFQQLGQGILFKYSIEGWLSEIFNL